jgi:phage regulator Rha-like protein
MMSKDLPLSTQEIENRIFTIRDLQVMIDRDLAELYGVETKVLNQAVKRNLDRFPDEFRFQLNEEEVRNLVSINFRFGYLGSAEPQVDSRSQFVTLKRKQGKNIKYLPFAFTEQGVAMLSAVLRSEIAMNVSIQIIKAFVSMRKLLQDNQLIISRLDTIEFKQFESDQKFDKIFKALESKDHIPSQGVFFDGQVFDAYELASRIIRSAKTSIILIDNYINHSNY